MTVVTTGVVALASNGQLTAMTTDKVVVEITIEVGVTTALDHIAVVTSDLVGTREAVITVKVVAVDRDVIHAARHAVSHGVPALVVDHTALVAVHHVTTEEVEVTATTRGRELTNAAGQRLMLAIMVGVQGALRPVQKVEGQVQVRLLTLTLVTVSLIHCHRRPVITKRPRTK